jgi:hypothetical protein
LDQGHAMPGEVSRTRLVGKKAAWLEQQQRQA